MRKSSSHAAGGERTDTASPGSSSSSGKAGLGTERAPTPQPLPPLVWQGGAEWLLQESF